jgi:chloride channel protein, CIC family
VIFGGSTGIEVSTVVASATIGSVVQQKANFFREYKTELICAGVAAGITALFNSPAAGFLFAYEVIARKISKVFALATVIAIGVASVLIYTLKEAPLFAIEISGWHYRALPYFLVLGVLAGLHGVYLTRCVLFFKQRFATMAQQRKIVIGALILSLALLALPQLYGDGYHAIKTILAESHQTMTLSVALPIIGILLLKPVVTSATLASGGDGGVFAPSLFIGAFLGLILAVGLNVWFGADVIPVNFMVIGMAAMLSASIHAPFTAVFLVCGLIGNYMLFFPILGACLISKFTAKAIYPKTVYTFSNAQ